MTTSLTTPSPRATVVPNLACFTRGDDLARLLAHGATPSDALRAYEALLRGDADRIAAIAAVLDAVPPGQATIASDGHYIGITLPTPEAEALVAAAAARREVQREELHEHEARRRW
ncbi:MAG TPA: hypothetical protein VGD56_03610 [Gemmatirosa sp.]